MIERLIGFRRLIGLISCLISLIILATCRADTAYSTAISYIGMAFLLASAVEQWTKKPYSD